MAILDNRIIDEIIVYGARPFYASWWWYQPGIEPGEGLFGGGGTIGPLPGPAPDPGDPDSEGPRDPEEGIPIDDEITVRQREVGDYWQRQNIMEFMSLLGAMRHAELFERALVKSWTFPEAPAANEPLRARVPVEKLSQMVKVVGRLLTGMSTVLLAFHSGKLNEGEVDLPAYAEAMAELKRLGFKYDRATGKWSWEPPPAPEGLPEVESPWVTEWWTARDLPDLVVGQSLVEGDYARYWTTQDGAHRAREHRDSRGRWVRRRYEYDPAATPVEVPTPGRADVEPPAIAEIKWRPDQDAEGAGLHPSQRHIPRVRFSVTLAPSGALSLEAATSSPSQRTDAESQRESSRKRVPGKEAKSKNMQRYLAGLRFVNKVWGPASEAIDFANAVQMSFYSTSSVWITHNGRQVMIAAGRPLYEVPLSMKAAYLREVYRLGSWHIDTAKLIETVAMQQMSDFVIGRIGQLEESVLRDLYKDNHPMRNMYGNPSTWANRIRGHMGF